MRQCREKPNFKAVQLSARDIVVVLAPTCCLAAISNFPLFVLDAVDFMNDESRLWFQSGLRAEQKESCLLFRANVSSLFFNLTLSRPQRRSAFII
jgi:hypothetical protein